MYGIVQCFVPEPPDNSYARGRLQFNNIGAKIGAAISKDKHWWTNGTNQKFAKECPADGFILGRKRF